jgi:Met-zincin/Domain of unknown function (DUF5117)
MRPWNATRWAVLLAFALMAGSFAAFADDNDDDDDEKPSDRPAAKSKSSPTPKPAAEEKKFRDYNDVVRGATKIEGFFNLQRKDEHLYAEITPHQFDQEFLLPVTLARGLAHAGWPLGDGDTLVLYFHRAGDKVQLIRKNIYFKAPDHSPLEKAVKQNYTDSVLMALPIVTIHQGGNQAVLVDLADVFLTDFAGLGIGHLDRNRTSWHKIKGFPNNLEIEVEATFGGFGGYFGGGDPTADGRGRTVVIHYSLAKMPEHGYHSRHADDRVGYFLNTYKDFGSSDPDTNAVRYVNRWRLEKADHKAKLSAPKKQIVWYVEDTVPHEYRPAVEEGIREWNKAFEKIGFRDAIAVRWQDPGRDEFDPEDINYCTFRWITTAETFAMSCLRSNPVTGEMIDGDVIFDASWVRVWKQQYAFLTGSVTSSTRGALTPATETLAVGRILSPIKAAKEGFGLPQPLPRTRAAVLAESSRAGVPAPELVPAGWTELDQDFRRRQGSGRFLACQLNTGMRAELGLAVLALAAEDKGKDKDKSKDKDKKDDEPALPEGLLNQLIKEVVMHEVGHSLGLRHNFKASTMLTAEQLNDPAVTKVKGQSGSVMDYNPINLAPRGQKQGEYISSTIGPYDYWAIEYAYKPIDGDEEDELKKLAARSPETDLIFATDEDMYLNDDPLVNVYDLGSDTLRFARDRMTLASDLLKDLDSKIVRDGESYARVRDAFSVLINQWGNASHLLASQIGGQSVVRDHKGKGARDPVVPIAIAKQREALTLLVEQILSDKAFKFPPSLLRRLSTDHWHDWGSGGIFSSGGSVEYPLNEEILGIQKIALGHCLGAGVLSRLQNQELQVDAGADALRPAEVFRVLTDGIWSEVTNPPVPADPKAAFALSTVRRNLQREHVRRLGGIVLGNRRNPYEDAYGFVVFTNAGTYPADARSLARMHLKTISTRISTLLARKDATVDDTTRAHLEDCDFKIKKVLDAGIQSNEP